MKELLEGKLGVDENKYNLTELNGKINKIAENSNRSIESAKGEFNAALSTKASIDRIDEILKVSINKQQLEGIDDQIKQIHEKISKIEEDLQSHPSSDGEGEDYEDEKDDYDSDEDLYQQEQTSAPDEIKEYVKDEETYPQGEISVREENKNDDAFTNNKTNVKSKLSFAIFDRDEKNKIYDSAQRQPYVRDKNKRSQHILKSHPKFGGSD